MKLKLPVSRFPREYDPNILEMMDSPEVDPILLREDLRNIQKINHWLGAYRLVQRELKIFFQNWFRNPENRSKTCRILDVCTGSGDIPRLIVRWCRQNQVRVEVTATDINPLMIQQAIQESSNFPEIDFREVDVLKLPFERQSYDWTMCHLALHHFSAEQAVLVLKELWSIARTSLLINDLHRSRILTLSTKVLIPLFSSNPITRFDAYLSTRRAFTSNEMLRLAFHAGIPTPRIRHYFLSRQVLIASKPI